MGVMRKIIFFIAIFFTANLAQDLDQPSLKDNILLGGDIGLTFTSSDYKDVGVGLMIRGVGEYYFYENYDHKIGVRGFAGYGLSSGKDNRYNPDGFSTALYTLAFGGVYSYQFSNVISPYVFAGIKFLRFNPKDSDGKALPNNAANNYDRNIVNLALEFGLRYRFSDDIYGYSSLTPLNLTNDYIDDKASGNAKDLVVSLNFGLLYKFTAPWADTELNTEAELPSGIEETSDEQVMNEKVEESDEEINEEVLELDDDKEVVTTENKAEEIVAPVGIEETTKDSGSETAADVAATKSNIVEELSHKLEFSTVKFDFGKTELSRMEYVELDRLLSIIEKEPKSRWKILGYTDNLEPIQIHQSLAIQRAYFVMRYFMGKGIDRDRFEVVVKGEEDPIGDNSTEKGRAENRRVEIFKMN